MGCGGKSEKQKAQGRKLGTMMVDAARAGTHVLKQIFDVDRETRKVIASFYPRQGQLGTSQIQWAKYRDPILSWAKDAASLKDPFDGIRAEELADVEAGLLSICESAQSADGATPELHPLYQVALRSQKLKADAAKAYEKFLRAAYAAHPHNLLHHIRARADKAAPDEFGVLTKTMADLDNPKSPDKEYLDFLHASHRDGNRETRFAVQQAMRKYFDQRLPALNFKSEEGQACISMDEGGNYFCYSGGQRYYIEPSSPGASERQGRLLLNDQITFFQTKRIPDQTIHGTLVSDTTTLPENVRRVIRKILSTQKDITQFDGSHRVIHAAP